MRVSVIGVGHVGLVTAACMAELGHDVIGMDDDAAKVASLRAGRVPFVEPGLQELVDRVTAAGRLTFTDQTAEAVRQADVVFICVGTPRKADGAPNLAYVQQAAASVAEHADGPLVVAEKSTVPVRTGERIRHALALHVKSLDKDVAHHVVSNPEFLREGTAVADTLGPDRVVVGADSDHAHDVMRRLYAPLLERHDCPYVATDVRTAELIKHASNAFLATKISFINAVARIAELAGADVHTIADAMGHDVRIGRAFLNAGLGYGGSCLVSEETVLARRDETVRLLTMGELFAVCAATGVSGWEVLSWESERRAPVFLPVAAVTARPHQGEIVEVRTKMGRRLRCTPDHPFVVGDGRMEAVSLRLAGELSERDWLPVACGRWGGADEGPRRLNVLAAVGAETVARPDVIQRLDAAQVEAVREAPGLAPGRRRDVLRNGAMRLVEFEALGLRASGGSFGTARNGTYVPGEITLDVDFWRMVGLYLAEGYVTADGRRRRIYWTFHPTNEAELADVVVRYWEQLGVKVSVHRRQTALAVSVSSRLLASWLLDVLDVGRDAYTKNVPDIAWQAPADHQRALLRGLWDGDGSWSLIAGGPSVVLEYGTVSRRLADAMVRLLGHLGVIARLKVGRTAKSTVDTYWLVISGADQVEAALWLFPPEEAEEIAAHIGRQCKRIAPTGYRRDGEGTAWVRVTDVRRYPFDGWVYSLEIPGAHTVVTSGGLVTHNCFPKDVEAFVHIAGELGYDFGLLRETDRINREAKQWPLGQLRRLLWNLDGKEVAVLGVAFKPGTDDIRDAPALDVIDGLIAEGARVRLHDPVALAHVEGRWPEATLHDKAEDALRGAHAAVVCTEWDEYRAIAPERVAELLAYPVVVDARNVWDPAALEAAGVTVAAVGRALPDAPGA